MHAIIAGTDFSACSRNAVFYAAHLCSVIGSQLVIVHVHGNHSISENPSGNGNPAAQQLDEIASALHTQFAGLHIRSLLQDNVDPVTGLLAAAERSHPWLIVLGSQGNNERHGVFLGTTTGELIKSGTVPVLAIPGKCRFTPYKQILFAVKNSSVGSKSVIEPYLTLSQHFKVHTTLLHVTRDSMPDLSRFPDPYPITAHADDVLVLDSDNIYLSVQAFMHEKDVDLVIVINRLRGFFEGLFVQGVADVAAFNSEMPCLVLHGSIRV